MPHAKGIAHLPTVSPLVYANLGVEDNLLKLAAIIAFPQ